MPQIKLIYILKYVRFVHIILSKKQQHFPQPVLKKLEFRLFSPKSLKSLQPVLKKLEFQSFSPKSLKIPKNEHKIPKFTLIPKLFFSSPKPSENPQIPKIWGWKSPDGNAGDGKESWATIIF